MTRFRGIFGIIVTPFNEDFSVDYDSLRNELDFCAASGGHGIVLTANAGEFSSLSDAERNEIVVRAIEHNAGRLPVIVGVSGVSAPVAAEFASLPRLPERMR